MKLSDVLKTVNPVKFYGIRVEQTRDAENVRNDELHEPKAMRLSLSPDPNIASVHYKAQEVQPGGLFVAIQGLSADGHDFIDEALARGASAVVTQKYVEKDTVIIEVENTRKALATLSGRFYSNPAKELFLIGITGTNGKTTTAFLIERVLSEAGIPTGVIGTLNYRYLGKTFQNPMTTPESLDLQKILAEMLEQGTTHVVMEVSSHAIDLDRVYDCKFDLGVFTNLTQDHLDYHQDMQSYWLCKKRFFTQYLDFESGNGRILAVVNHNDERGKELIEWLEAKMGKKSVLSVGFSGKNRVCSEFFTHDLNGIQSKISTPSGSFEFKSPLVGRHNLENILCATGAAIALDLPVDSIKGGIESVKSVPGRLEPVPNAMNRFVYVDYAHTPDALENVLLALKSSAPDRVVCVFGCGGNRDKGKRPQMGQIAGRLSHLVIITSDNPRTEPPMEIIDQIVSGIQTETSNAYRPSDLTENFKKRGYVVEPDRRSAIQLAMMVSKSGDTILIAGKGNESYQIIGNKTIVFDDRKEAEKALSMLDIKSFGCKTRSNPQVLSGNPKSVKPNLIPWKTSEIIEATGGELFCGDLARMFTGISIDSRRISTDDLFVGIKGDVHDGHRFIGGVIEKGVSGFLIEKRKTDQLPVPALSNTGIVCITVDDTGKALGDLAAFNRRRTPVSVIAVTGSNGKTSTRQMISDVVSRRYCTLSTQGNLNNDIGLPLTLLNLNKDHQWAVVELGMNRPGEIERLAEICSPDLGVITNIGPAHLEGLGSLDAVMKAKGELLEKIKPDGIAVLNADDQRLLTLADTTSRNVLFFGRSENAMVRALAVKKEQQGLSFSLVLPNTKSVPVKLRTPAFFMVSNALAAAAVGCLLDLAPEEIKKGLESFEPVKGRMNILTIGKGIHIIDDTYNANPGSMAVAIKTLESLKEKNRGILVTGDMLELGKYAGDMHHEMGSMAAGSDISRIYATGEFAEKFAAGAMEGGKNSEDIFIGTQEEILTDITDRLESGDWILVKGSRGMAMEKVVQGLLAWADN